MKDPNNPCLFCDVKKTGIVYENELAYTSYDSYPVSEHHCLIIPKRHIVSYFECNKEEYEEIPLVLNTQKTELKLTDDAITGFNIGMNIGEDAGQTVFHFHIHIIPRRKGDIDNPKGGIRGVIPNKQKY